MSATPTAAEMLRHGEKVAEGKTKIIFKNPADTNSVLVVSKDDITAGDGAKHDILLGKGRLATQTTCNVFELLKACGLPAAYSGRVDETSFIAPGCAMLPYEVVVRRESHGSALKRNPHFTKGHFFPKLVVEFYLKTKDKQWKGTPLVVDDPLMEIDYIGDIKLFNPAKPLIGQEPFLRLSLNEVFTQKEEPKLIEQMKAIAKHTFLVLEKAWQLEGGRLVDFKVEFGVDAKGNLLLADVIDNDSWRVIENGGYIDKQVYRDGGALSDVMNKYQRVAELTSRFRMPLQQIILWRGSKSDDPIAFLTTVKNILGEEQLGLVTDVVCSVHKEPVAAAFLLNKHLQKIPDAVVIAYVGRSNGAGPTLSAMSTVPVITVPANVKEFPEDAWSSLRSPSNVPVMTVFEPANAVLAALQILSARNPYIYMKVRSEIEKRQVNVLAL